METTILNTDDLTQALGNLGLPVAFSGVDIAPSTVFYHFDLKNPLDLKKVKNVVGCLAAYIHKDIRVEKSERASFCLSIPRDQREFPNFTAYHNALKDKQPGEILFGIGENGQPITRNITQTKSMLVGGSSGGGKSVCLNEMLCSLICYTKPEHLGLVLIDLKRCEFELFKNSNHLALPVQFDYEGAFQSLRTVQKEIERRYKEMQTQGIRKATVDKYPLLVVFIDEYAELASHSNKNELDNIVSRIASTGRACNVFIVVATQHAISTIISNTIKSNLQSRIGLRTSNVAQSTCIIGTRDCVDLLGYGDSFISFDGVAGLQRVQVCNIDETVINKILEKQNNDAASKQTNNKLIKEKKQTKWQRFCQRVNNWFEKVGIKSKPRHHKHGLDVCISQSVNDLNYYDCVIDDDNE